MEKDQPEDAQAESQNAALEVVLRRDCSPSGLSVSEVEALGSILPELVGELLQMELDSKSE